MHLSSVYASLGIETLQRVSLRYCDRTQVLCYMQETSTANMIGSPEVYSPPHGHGFLFKGIQAGIPFKRNPGPRGGVYFWAAYSQAARVRTLNAAHRILEWLRLHASSEKFHDVSRSPLVHAASQRFAVIVLAVLTQLFEWAKLPDV